MKDNILALASDLVVDFLYYDRKDDEDLGVGDIEKMIQRGEVTIDEIVETFRHGLEKNIKV